MAKVCPLQIPHLDAGLKYMRALAQQALLQDQSDTPASRTDPSQGVLDMSSAFLRNTSRTTSRGNLSCQEALPTFIDAVSIGP